MVRILFVTYCRAMLGANRSMLNLIKDLRLRYKVEAEVLMPKVNDGELKECLDKEGITNYQYDIKPWVVAQDVKLKNLRRISFLIKNFFFCNKIKRGLGKNKYDLIYSNNSTIQTGAYLAKKWNIPHIWHIREYGKQDYGIEFIYPKSMVKRYFTDSNMLIAISDGIAQYAKSELSATNNVIKIYNGINCEIGKKVFNINEINFAIVGALRPEKNQFELLRALKLVVEKGYTNIKVNIIGSGSTYLKELVEYVKDNKLEEYVKFWGYVSNVDEILRMMDVGVICSKMEAFGRVTCEYMAYSMPVIGAASGATIELVRDGYNGLLYPAGEEKVLADKMIRFLESKTLIEQYGNNAYKHVCENFSIRRNTDSIFEVIKNVCSTGGNTNT